MMKSASGGYLLVKINKKMQKVQINYSLEIKNSHRKLARVRTFDKIRSDYFPTKK